MDSTENSKLKTFTSLPYFFIAGIAISFLLSLVLLQLFTFLLVITWLADSKKNKLALNRIGFILFAFILIRIISIVFSEYFLLSVHALYKDALYSIGFFAMASYIKSFSNNQRKNILELFLLFSVIVSLVGITKFMLGIKPRAESIVSGYATFSTYLLAGIAIFFSFFSDLKKRINPWFLVVSGIIILLAIVLALSRADLGIAIAIVFLAVLQKKMEWKYLLPVLFLTAILSLFSFQQNSGEIKSRLSQPATMSQRDVLWKSAFQLAGEHPLIGFGPRTFEKIFPNRDQLSDKGVGGWHNDYLTVYLESGIVGLMVFLLLIYQIIKKGYQKFLFTDNWNWGIFISIIALLLSAGMSGFINNPILSLLFVFMLAFFSSELESEN